MTNLGDPERRSVNLVRCRQRQHTAFGVDRRRPEIAVAVRPTTGVGTVRFARVVKEVQFSTSGKVHVLEVDADSVRAWRANVAYAGYADKVEILEGSSSEVIQTLDGTFDLVFLDHWKDLYERDLRLIEERGLLRVGSTVVADNVGEMFGADTYLEYVRSCGRYDSENRRAHIEYSELPDAVEISVYRGPS